ncbi:MAG: transposase [Coleofasciculus sp. C2-GNP5-27]
MLVAYTYKLSPSRQQVLVMDKHLEMLRLQYNFRVRERTEAYEQASAPVLGNYCNLRTKAECCPLTCSVSKNALYGNPWTRSGKKRGAYAQQDASLPNLKRERPWYKAIQHHVLQQMLRRVENAFQRFFKGEGKYPKPKRRSKYRSWSYPPKDVRFKGNKVRLPGIGWCKFFSSRAFPDGFSTRTVTVRKKADGWYISVQLRDESVPATPTPDAAQTAIGVDLGIKKLASVSTGELIPNPQYGKKAQRRRQLLSRRASRKSKGSARRRKAYAALARLEQKVERQRTDYHWKVANQLVNLGECIIFEDLNIKGMMARCKPKVDPETGKYLKNGQAQKRGLNRVIADAAWGELKQKVKVVAAKSGVLVHEINPKYTSQECSCCGYVSPTNRDKEKFLCESCGWVADADVDAASVIRQRGLTELGINIPLPVVHGKVTLKEPVKDRGNHLGCQMSLRTLGWNGFNSAYSSGGESE